ncbi:MAG: 3'-5' exonuclease [Oscillospiraceae bacterium]|nr:3'-5' exonuclease [Oscillospiraceae bacterium]
MLKTLFEEFDSLLVLDTETTGVVPRRDEVIELAMLRVDARGAREEYDELIRLSPGTALPEQIRLLTGITEEMLASEGLSKGEAARALADRLGRGERTLVCAYNAQFDLVFLYYLLDAYGLAGALRGARFLDALTVYRDRRPYPHRLCDALEAYALSAQNTHRALDDTRATFELLCAMDAEEGDLLRYINLFGYNARYGLPPKRISSVTYRPQGFDALGKLYDREQTPD